MKKWIFLTTALVSSQTWANLHLAPPDFNTSDVAVAYASTEITGLGDEAVTLDDTTLAATALNALDGETTGVVNAGSVTTLTGSASDVTAAYASTGITGLGDEAVTLDDTTLAVTALNALDGETTGVVNACSVS